MRLLFKGEGRFADFAPAYELYLRRKRSGNPLDETMYRRVLKAYCRRLALRLEEDGMVDLPCELGSIGTALIGKRYVYRNGKYVGYGAFDYKKWEYDGNLKAFGVAYLPKHGNDSLRCFGFVANRNLFQRMKKKYMESQCSWIPMDFNIEMI